MWKRLFFGTFTVLWQRMIGCSAKLYIESYAITTICIEDFKKRSMMGFPWQEHEKEYLHLTCSDSWWKHAVYYAKSVREVLIYADDYSLYDDTIEVLRYFRDKGYSNIILSNHIPELGSIVERLSLSQYISQCISSANVGYEKPNPKIYEYALEKTGFVKEVWMVGDSIQADIVGAESVGIKAVLVRSKADSLVRYHTKDLLGLKNIIVSYREAD